LLLQLIEGALALKEVAKKKQRESAEAEEGDAEGPLVSFRMDKDERVHEESQAGGQDQNEDRGKDRKLEAAPLEAIEFLTIDCSHHPTCSSNLPARAGSPEVANRASFRFPA